MSVPSQKVGLRYFQLRLSEAWFKGVNDNDEAIELLRGLLCQDVANDIEKYLEFKPKFDDESSVFTLDQLLEETSLAILMDYKSSIS